MLVRELFRCRGVGGAGLEGELGLRGDAGMRGDAGVLESLFIVCFALVGVGEGEGEP